MSSVENMITFFSWLNLLILVFRIETGCPHDQTINFACRPRPHTAVGNYCFIYMYWIGSLFNLSHYPRQWHTTILMHLWDISIRFRGENMVMVIWRKYRWQTLFRAIFFYIYLSVSHILLPLWMKRFVTYLKIDGFPCFMPGLPHF